MARLLANSFGPAIAVRRGTFQAGAWMMENAGVNRNNASLEVAIKALAAALQTYRRVQAAHRAAGTRDGGRDRMSCIV